ncbi:disease resistance protein RPV1 [Eucalyptus grandis]|uniref:disease resistance protein RPV1 n=1 Tax=Eucalyptus grandis TaxID=71139 RepID=UPI00192EB2A7|nr:disease resistance protein RPV1 [Eucalyptus grandis]
MGTSTQRHCFKPWGHHLIFCSQATLVTQTEGRVLLLSLSQEHELFSAFPSQIAMDKGQSQRKRKRAQKESTEGASTSSFISPKLIGQGDDAYDVFLSFRGSDTRKEFTDHLYNRLVNTGTVPIFVFKDDKSIPIGEDFSSQILGAISRSKISIPIISENYATSKWCLRELIHMMDCKNSGSHIVLPIFYKVKPADVRHLKGNFGDAFRSSQKYFDEKVIQEGPQALKEVSDLQVWESEKFANGYVTGLFFGQKKVLSKLQQDFQLNVTKHLVGFEDHVSKIRNWVDTPASVARMIGIYGMGGIGKTTLAKSIYNQLLDGFVHHSFLANIRETAQCSGIPYLQNQLIEEVLQIECQIRNVDHGISLIRSKFKGKKVLILLDDIDNKKQLDALAGERNWFMSGSIIIVTTRNKAILDQSEIEIDYPYELNGLDEEHSLLLLKRHAFRTDCCPTEFEDISCEIIITMGGLPLAIEVVGSYLFKKTKLNVWIDVLKQLKEQPHEDVQAILRISYDALKEGHKQIFLDIACFVIREEIKFAMYMWEDCGFCPSQGIEELVLRCLIKIENDDKLWMHDQLRDLGRSIFCQGQSPKRYIEPWIGKETFGEQILGKRFRSEFDYWPSGCSFTCTSELFKNIPSSSFLPLCWTTISGDFNELLPELRWLQWLYIEPDIISSATNLHLSKLVVLELSRNKLTDDWGGWSSIMVAKQLKVLNLSYSWELRYTPNLSAFTKLEILILSNCYKLKQVDPSIGKLKSLISLDLCYSNNLKELPEEVGELQELKELLLNSIGITKIPMSVCSLRKLEYLVIESCCSLVEIPLVIGNLYSLKQLDLRMCKSLIGIPSSIGNLSSLEQLNLWDCKLLTEIPNSIGNLSSLEQLNLGSCESLTEIPNSIGNLSSLKQLDLGSCKSLTEIPSSIGNLSSLEQLDLGSCKSLTKIPSSIGNLSSLEQLDLGSCESLTEIPSSIGNLSSLEKLNLRYCKSLIEIPNSIENLSSLKKLNLGFCRSLTEIPSSIGNLSSLKQLNLWYCESLTEIPSSIGNLSFLKQLVIDRNP